MATFGSVLAKMLMEQEPLLSVDTPDAGERDEEALDAFRRGMHLRSEKESDATFWNELKKVACENRKGLARLLQVSPSVIGRWPAIIDQHMKHIESEDAHSNGVKRPEMIPTGHKTITSKPAVGMQGNFGDTNVPHIRGPF